MVAFLAQIPKQECHEAWLSQPKKDTQPEREIKMGCFSHRDLEVSCCCRITQSNLINSFVLLRFVLLCCFFDLGLLSFLTTLFLISVFHLLFLFHSFLQFSFFVKQDLCMDSEPVFLDQYSILNKVSFSQRRSLLERGQNHFLAVPRLSLIHTVVL